MYIRIPAPVMAVITSPGVVAHEFSHQLVCKMLKIPVYDVKYFQVGNPCGYVLHELSDKPYKTALVSIGPFIINTLIGMLLLVPVYMDFKYGVNHYNPLIWFLGWVGITVLMHAFPSKGDAKVMINAILKNKEVKLVTKILVAPIVGLIYIGAIGSVVWLDLIYAFVIYFTLTRFIAVTLLF